MSISRFIMALSFGAVVALAQEASPRTAVEALFAAMAKHDAAAARALFLPEAHLFSVRADQTAPGLHFEKWLERWPAAEKDRWEERIASPQVLEHGTIAAVWGEYTFHLNGKLHHCGVDSVQLLKTAAGWKIASITDTRETCAAPPAASASEHFSFGKESYRVSVVPPRRSQALDERAALLLIHGAGGRGTDMIPLWKDLAEREGVVLIAPDFPLDAQFETTVPRLLPALLDWAYEREPFDRKRVYVFGYSAGGYIAFDAATLCSKTFAAAGVFASVIAPGYDGIVDQAARKTPIAMYIGDRDQFFTLAQVRRTRDLLQAKQFPVHSVELANRDHQYAAVSERVNADAWTFFKHYSLNQ